MFVTLEQTDCGDIAFAHVDINTAAATTRVLDYVWPRIVPGGAVVLDDYGYRGYEDQRVAVDDWSRSALTLPLALPTGQALLFKR